MNVVAIIQARMSSSRLPGKVLMPLAERPVLWHVFNRIKGCRTIQKVVVATSIDASDDAIGDWCRQNGIALYRGSLQDVLDRYYQAAKCFGAEAVVRITADCPAIDPEIVDEVVSGFISGHYDCYGLAGEFPDGLDCTVFSFDALERAWKDARLNSEREHVGPYIENHPELFSNGALYKFKGLGHHRWTLDEPRDYTFLQQIFNRLFIEGINFSSGDVLNLLEKEPELLRINGSITRNEGYLKSVTAERNCNVQP